MVKVVNSYYECGMCKMKFKEKEQQKDVRIGALNIKAAI